MKHDTYADPCGGGWSGYRARCNTCEWTGPLRLSKPLAMADAKHHAALALACIPHKVDLWVCPACGRVENEEWAQRPVGDPVYCNRHTERPFPTMAPYRYALEVPLNVWR